VVDNLSRGNYGAVQRLHSLFPRHVKFLALDIGDKRALTAAFAQ
jgi:hypothetical protein